MVSVEEMFRFCKRKGFVYPSSEIYGGFAGFYDYGPLGVELKNNIKRLWWKYMVLDREDIVGIDGSIICHPKVWKASGHYDNFVDYVTKCKKCGKSYRADHLIEEKKGITTTNLKEMQDLIKDIKCPSCGGELGEIKEFNLMFKTYVGPVESKETEAYLRPETAQIIFLNFKNIINTTRVKLPFGIAQIGKVFRNEISPRNFLFRMREFEQMEVEFFAHPKKLNECKDYDEIKDLEVNALIAGEKEMKTAKISDLYPDHIKTKWHAFWIGYRYKWYLDLGLNPEKLRIRQHDKEELSHYSEDTWDIEYKYDFGWKELEGVADRTDFDLSKHMEASGEDLRYFDEETKERILPNVAAEPSVGVDRVFLTVLMDSYHEEEVKGEKRVVLKLNPKLAPYKVAVFPLVKKDGLAEKAKEVYSMLKKEFHTFYDESGSIGRRYRRMDEIGTPWCVTIDYDTLNDDTVTIRDRDSMEQVRVKISELKDWIRVRL